MDVVSGILRKFMNKKAAREQYSFELLKSNSAQEFRPREQGLPRFRSHHDQLRLPSPAGQQPNKVQSEEVIEYSGTSMSDVSSLLGFVHSDVGPSCSNFGFTSEDASYEKSVAECHSIRENSIFTEGVLLKCIDRKPLFPFLHYAHFKSPDYIERINEISQVVKECGASPGSQYGCYDEVYTIQKAASGSESRLPAHRHAGYIVIGFKLLDEPSKQQSLEKTWLQWTGAREIYKYSPRGWNLRRISLLRSPNSQAISIRNGQSRPFVYILMCEYGSILHPSNTVQALDLCERMRVRNCGHVALYQVHTAYSASQLGLRSPRRRVRNPMMRGFSQDVEPTEPRRGLKLRTRERSFGYMEEEHYDGHPTVYDSYQARNNPHHTYCD